jgi:hypothetical protein
MSAGCTVAVVSMVAAEDELGGQTGQGCIVSMMVTLRNGSSQSSMSGEQLRSIGAA